MRVGSTLISPFQLHRGLTIIKGHKNSGTVGCDGAGSETRNDSKEMFRRMGSESLPLIACTYLFSWFKDMGRIEQSPTLFGYLELIVDPRTQLSTGVH